jgi:hypothetical protein
MESAFYTRWDSIAFTKGSRSLICAYAHYTFTVIFSFPPRQHEQLRMAILSL